MFDRWHATWGVLDGWGRASLLTLIVAAIGQTLFVVVYLTRRWWTVRVGRALMVKSASLAIVLLLTALAALFPVPEWSRTLALVLVTLGIWYQTYVLITSPSQYLDRQDDPYEGIQRSGSVRPESSTAPEADPAGNGPV
jgi:hypothetical protein